MKVEILLHRHPLKLQSFLELLLLMLFDLLQRRFLSRPLSMSAVMLFHRRMKHSIKLSCKECSYYLDKQKQLLRLTLLIRKLFQKQMQERIFHSSNCHFSNLHRISLCWTICSINSHRRF